MGQISESSSEISFRITVSTLGKIFLVNLGQKIFSVKFLNISGYLFSLTAYHRLVIVTRNLLVFIYFAILTIHSIITTIRIELCNQGLVIYIHRT